MLDRIVNGTAALLGAAGVGFGAIAAHADTGNLAIASSFLLFHAPAVLALGVTSSRARLIIFSRAAILVGVILFSGSLALTTLVGAQIRPSPMPLGGTLMIFGWLLAAAHFLSGDAGARQIARHNGEQ